MLFLSAWMRYATTMRSYSPPQGEGSDISYNIDGAINSKAWVRGVKQIIVVGSPHWILTGCWMHRHPSILMTGSMIWTACAWILVTDRVNFQGVPLGKVLAAMKPQAGSEIVTCYTDGESLSFSLAEVLSDDDIRLFTVIGHMDVTFALARMNGEVLLAHVTRIEVQ